MACPASCNSIELLANPAAGCTTSRREKTVSRLAFFSCATTLPDPLTGAAMVPLFADGTVVASMPLANIVWNDPTTSEIMMDECSPMDRKIDTREATFEDRYAVAKDLATSPATTDEYWDYKFWQNKNDVQSSLAYMIIYCDGDVVIPRQANGQYMTATILVYLSWQKPTTQGGSWVEFKKGSIIFQGDPMSMSNAVPAFNYIDAGIVL